MRDGAGLWGVVLGVVLLAPIQRVVSNVSVLALVAYGLLMMFLLIFSGGLGRIYALA